MVKRRRLNSSVAALVRQLRKRHESIWNWSERKPGEVEVLLGPPPKRRSGGRILGSERQVPALSQGKRPVGARRPRRLADVVN
jgi:hypothetical protein